MTEVLLAVDIGGTTMKAAAVGLDGRPWAALVQPTAAGEGTDALAGLLALLNRLDTTARSLGGRPAAVGVVTPGIVDEDTGVVGYASNLGWRDVPLRTRVEERLGLPVAVGHDVRAAGLAEATLGAARGSSDFLLLPLGTGIAAGVVLDGRPVRGASHSAGELGHVPVHPDGVPCPCGQRGCLEAYASGAGLLRRYREAGGSAATTAEQLVTRLGSDAAADAAWAGAVRALGLGLATATLLFDPALIVLGGGLSAAGEVLRAPVARAVQAQLAWRAAPPVATSPLGSLAGRIGAGLLALRAAGLDARWTTEGVLAAPPAA